MHQNETRKELLKTGFTSWISHKTAPNRPCRWL